MALTSGNCTCQAGTGARAGKALDFIWRSGGQTYIWNAPERYCNPYQCSNSKCFSNGCAKARSDFCGRYAVYGTTDKAKLAVANKLSNICNLSASFRDSIVKILDGYASGINNIVNLSKSCNNSAAEAAIVNLANAVRCAQKCNPAIRGRCDGGIPGCTAAKAPKCGGDPNPSANDCGCSNHIFPDGCNLVCNIGKWSKEALGSQNIAILGIGGIVLLVLLLKK